MLIIQRTTCMLICTKIINNQMLHCKLLYMADPSTLGSKKPKKNIRIQTLQIHLTAKHELNIAGQKRWMESRAQKISSRSTYMSPIFSMKIIINEKH